MWETLIIAAAILVAAVYVGYVFIRVFRKGGKCASAACPYPGKKCETCDSECLVRITSPRDASESETEE